MLNMIKPFKQKMELLQAALKLKRNEKDTKEKAM